MAPRTVGLLITLATVCVNIFFAYTGVTDSVSCTVSKTSSAVVEHVFAAEVTDKTP